MLVKICPKCGKEKEIDKFSNNQASSDGKYTICKDCHNAEQRAGRLKPKRKRDNEELVEEILRVQKHILCFYIENKEYDNDNDRKVLWAFCKYMAGEYGVKEMI